MTESLQEEYLNKMFRNFLGGIEYYAGFVSEPELREGIGKLGTFFKERDLKELASRFMEYPRGSHFKEGVGDLLKRISERTSQDPAYLVKLWGFDYESTDRTILDHIGGDGLTKAQKNILFNAEALFKYSMGAVHLLTSMRLAPEGYILGVRDDGSVVSKFFRVGSSSERDRNRFFQGWYDMSIHAPFFMKLDADSLDELVHDEETWMDTNSNNSFPSYFAGHFLGRKLFRFGSEQKVYASPRPHRIVLDNEFFDSITVMDRFHEGIIFKAKYADKKISVGFMNLIPEEDREVPLEGDVGTDAEESYKVSFESSSFAPFVHVTKIQCLFNEGGILCATVGAIARDMFVCEEKTRFYQERISEPPATRANPRPTQTVIWLPRERIHYEGIPNRSEEELGHIVQDIAPTEVTGHPRKCKNPSPKQLELAKLYRVNVPEGHTFVKPHPRSGYKRTDPVYKSRSALQVLFGVRNETQ